MNRGLIYLFSVLAVCLAGSVVLLLTFATEPIEQAREPTPGKTLLAWATLDSSSEPIQPIPRGIILDERKIALGESLFHDPRLSHDDTVSCANCHQLDQGGDDGLARSLGIGGAEGLVNAPTVFNSGLNFVQFWDGRAATLEEQIDGPVHNSLEMGSNWPEIIGKLKRDPDYVAAFERIYEDGIQSDTIKDSIATFERSLITPNSRFDRFLLGEAGAITDKERAGYELFRSYGCSSCHQGRNVGGNMYQKLGVIGNYFADRADVTDVTEVDYGRFNVTGEQIDRFVFKVPSLRNVELTAPYLHDGSVETLKAAVEIMAKYNLGRPITAENTNAIVAFLKTLTGEYKGKPLWSR